MEQPDIRDIETAKEQYEKETGKSFQSLSKYQQNKLIGNERACREAQEFQETVDRMIKDHFGI